MKCPHCGNAIKASTEEIIQSVNDAFAIGAVVLDFGDRGFVTYPRNPQDTITLDRE
jgi:hypothetical protein